MGKNIKLDLIDVYNKITNIRQLTKTYISDFIVYFIRTFRDALSKIDS